MKKVIIIASNRVNTIKAEKHGDNVRIFDLYGDEFFMSPGDYNDPEYLKHTMSFFEGMENAYPHAETFDHDGLYGA